MLEKAVRQLPVNGKVKCLLDDSIVIECAETSSLEYSY